MRHLSIVLAMVAMLGIGMLAGSLLTPAARAQKPTVTDYNNPVPGYSPGTPYYPGTQYTYPVPVRWQVIIVPSLERRDAPLTILVDTLTGESFYLNYIDNRLYWSRITR